MRALGVVARGGARNRLRRSLQAGLLAFALVTGAHAGEPALPVAAIGKVNQSGYATRTMCTGVLVAPDRVLTAAHCLMRRDGKPHKAGEIHFVAGYDRGEYVAHALGRRLLIAPGYLQADSKAGRLGNDFAVIVLEHPLEMPPVRLAAPMARPLAGPAVQVIHAGYRRSRPEVLSVTETCLMRPRKAVPWASNCPTEHGSSGGPVFAETGEGLRLAGIMVATSGARASFVMPVTAWRSLVEAKAGR
jgi:V8-like Glu-specific endopeptidase